jgi:integrase
VHADPEEHDARDGNADPRPEHRPLPDAATNGLQLRHTYTSWSIAAGVGLFEVARRMGTSLEQIDRVYGHLLPHAEAHERDLLDAFEARQNEPRAAEK